MQRSFLLVCLGLLLNAKEAFPDGPLTASQRLEAEQLKATHEARLRFTQERRSLPSLGVFQDFRAVMHVHAEDSNHTKGTRAEVLAAAKKVGVQIVMLTDHGGPKPETWRGLHDGVLFIAGEENGGAGLLRFPAASPSPGDEELRFLSHIEERYDASPEGFVGMEISNRHSEAVLDKSTEEALRKAMSDPAAWHKLVEDFHSFPDEVFAAGTDYRARFFEKWDHETARHPFTGIGANDSHQNQIFQGTVFDPYEVSFRNLCTHILATDLSEREVRRALRDGHAYVSHDWLCDPTGFAFQAINNLGAFGIGDPVLMIRGTRLVALTPLAARLKLIHNGQVLQETTGTNLTASVTEPGPYRLEAWLRVAGEERPWIYSNPIYLRTPNLTDLQLPSVELDGTVEVKSNIPYLTVPVEDAKERLDIYAPKQAQAAPVFFFVHGGAWRSGDRSQYGPVANRFAKEGIITIVPSYRLAPKYRHPAQIEDVAAAFAWTVQHIAEYGGDTNRIYIGGHSAGGHLAALLALDDKYLREHHLSRESIRGVLALSGVYDLLSSEGQASVFGEDHQVRRDASPLFQIKVPAPPFLITYCQWDYISLPAQAREFHEALVRAGVPSQLIYIPQQSHISEMVNVPSPDDATAQAIVRFVKASPSMSPSTRGASGQAGKPLTPEEISAALKEGGYVVYVRHAQTDRSRDDVPQPDLKDCSTQRLLSHDGQKQAEALGAAIRVLGIPVGQVFSSPYCRAVETARRALSQQSISEVAELGRLARMPKDRIPAATSKLKELLSSAPRKGENTFIVGHFENLAAVGGPEIDEAGWAVFRPEKDTYRLVGRLNPPQWGELARTKEKQGK